MFLKDETDVAISEFGQLFFSLGPGIFATNQDLPTGWFIQSSGYVQERAFAAARRSSQCDRLTGSQLQIDMAQNLQISGRSRKFARHIVQFKSGHGFGVSVAGAL